MASHATRSDTVHSVDPHSAVSSSAGLVLYKSFWLDEFMTVCDPIWHTLLKTDTSIHINQNAL